MSSMTQATALSKPTNTTLTNAPSPGGFVMNLIVTLLAPIFLGIAGGDIGLARMAAVETLEDYRLRTQLDPIAVAQIVLNGLAALDSLSRSMVDDLSLETVLRLRCNSVGLNRAAEQNRRVRSAPHLPDATSFLTASQPDPEPPVQVSESVAPLEPDVFHAEPVSGPPALDTGATLANLEPVENTAITPTTEAIDDKRLRVMAMVNEVADLKASLRTLPKVEHDGVITRIAALDSTVHALLTGTTPTGRRGGAAYPSG